MYELNINQPAAHARSVYLRFKNGVKGRLSAMMDGNRSNNFENFRRLISIADESVSRIEGISLKLTMADC